MLEKVIENWTSRLDYIGASRGSPMPEIIFKIYNGTAHIYTCTPKYCWVFSCDIDLSSDGCEEPSNWRHVSLKPECNSRCQKRNVCSDVAFVKLRGLLLVLPQRV
ncbi:hypothetical protein TNCV_536461 [Trichonephila clavipes]|nr:hypothetical protein TNCV_536461 [Trichonephila clavipes]